MSLETSSHTNFMIEDNTPQGFHNMIGVRLTYIVLKAAHCSLTVFSCAPFHCAGREQFAGCTAIVVLVAGDRLVVGNAGDCRAVLCRDGKAVQVNREHTADDERERGRVAAAGARVARHQGAWRVGAAGLQVTRWGPSPRCRLPTHLPRPLQFLLWHDFALALAIPFLGGGPCASPTN